jgi:hypothetical protein
LNLFTDGAIRNTIDIPSRNPGGKLGGVGVQKIMEE